MLMLIADLLLVGISACVFILFIMSIVYENYLLLVSILILIPFYVFIPLTGFSFSVLLGISILLLYSMYSVYNKKHDYFYKHTFFYKNRPNISEYRTNQDIAVGLIITQAIFYIICFSMSYTLLPEMNNINNLEKGVKTFESLDEIQKSYIRDFKMPKKEYDFIYTENLSDLKFDITLNIGLEPIATLLNPEKLHYLNYTDLDNIAFDYTYTPVKSLYISSLLPEQKLKEKGQYFLYNTFYKEDETSIYNFVETSVNINYDKIYVYYDSKKSTGLRNYNSWYADFIRIPFVEYNKLDSNGKNIYELTYYSVYGTEEEILNEMTIKELTTILKYTDVNEKNQKLFFTDNEGNNYDVVYNNPLNLDILENTSYILVEYNNSYYIFNNKEELLNNAYLLYNE